MQVDNSNVTHYTKAPICLSIHLECSKGMRKAWKAEIYSDGRVSHGEKIGGTSGHTVGAQIGEYCLSGDDWRTLDNYGLNEYLVHVYLEEMEHGECILMMREKGGL